LFDIKYANIIKENNYSFKNIIKDAYYVAEITKGANLAKYVKER